MTNESQTPILRLVGCLQSGNSKSYIDFLMQFFGRLEEVKHRESLTRFIQYASGDDEQDNLRFAGIEVSEIESIPDGMIAWDINGSNWTVLEPGDGQDFVIWQGKAEWKWIDTSVPGRPVGEFAAICPVEWSSNGPPASRDFRIASHSYIGAPENDDIILMDYDPSWAEKYEQMKQRLEAMLGPDVALRIEHYGSTSIPGTPAKSIIDILVEIPSWDEVREKAIPAFNSPENEYWFYNDHMCFILRDKETGIRTHHIHMAPAGHRIWEGLAFRDYLRTHTEDAERYVALKYELARRYGSDREGYTNAKESFVREITDKALQGKG